MKLPMLSLLLALALGSCAHQGGNSGVSSFGADVVGNGIHPPATVAADCQAVQVFLYQNGTYDVVMTDASVTPARKTHFEAQAAAKSDPSYALQVAGTKYPDSSLTISADGTTGSLIVGGGDPQTLTCTVKQP